MRSLFLGFFGLFWGCVFLGVALNSTKVLETTSRNTGSLLLVIILQSEVDSRLNRSGGETAS